MIHRIFLLLCLAASLIQAQNPIVFDYHGVLFGKDSRAIKSKLFSYVKSYDSKGALLLTALNPYLWYSLLTFLRDDNQPEIVDALIERVPQLAVHRNALFTILNDEYPIGGMLKLLDGLQEAGMPLVLASNMYHDTYKYLSSNNPNFFKKFSLIFHAHVDGHGVKPETYYFKQLWNALSARYDLEGPVIFIDDNKDNVEAASRANQKWGTNFDPILFIDSVQLIQELIKRGYSVQYV